MAVRIRLSRVGATKRPAYRVVAIEGRKPRDGRSLEILGYYDPLTDPATVKIEAERVRTWISKGAQPSDTVVRLLRQVGLDAKAEATEEAAKPRPRRTPAKSASRPAARAKVAARTEPKPAAEEDSAPKASAEEPSSDASAEAPAPSEAGSDGDGEASA